MGVSVDINNVPIITKATAFLANIERTGQKRELYRFMTDSSEPNSTKIDELWLSEKDYNYVNADFTAIYVPEMEYELPDYVENYTLGIVEGRMRLDLHKVDRRGSSIFFSIRIKSQNNILNEDINVCINREEDL